MPRMNQSVRNNKKRSRRNTSQPSTRNDEQMYLFSPFDEAI